MEEKSLIEFEKESEPPERFDLPLIGEYYLFREKGKTVLPGRNEKCPCGSDKKFKKCHTSLDWKKYWQIVHEINTAT